MADQDDVVGAVNDVSIEVNDLGRKLDKIISLLESIKRNTN